MELAEICPNCGKVINDIIRDFSCLLILWFLNKEKLHGNAIINKINLFCPDEDKKIIGPGRIYPDLHNLEDKGLIKGSWETRGVQQIKYYEITDKGHEELLRVKERGVQQIKYYEITDKGHEELLRVKETLKYYVNDELKEFIDDMIFENGKMR